MLKPTACVPSLRLPFTVKLSSLKVSILFQNNFPVTGVSIFFPLNYHLQRGRTNGDPCLTLSVIIPWGIFNTISYGMCPSICGNLGIKLCQPMSLC